MDRQKDVQSIAITCVRDARTLKTVEESVKKAPMQDGYCGVYGGLFTT